MILSEYETPYEITTTILKSIASKKNYMDLFKEISAPTASRDLKMGVTNGLLEKTGDKKITLYKVRK